MKDRILIRLDPPIDTNVSTRSTAESATMSFSFGRSMNSTPAEKMRRNHGLFSIPHPKGRTAEERPFGLELTGNARLDYERIHIRIAAVQSGLNVLTERGGLIAYPKSERMGPPPTVIQRQIMKRARVYDAIWFRKYRDVPFKTRYQPVGFIPASYKDAATIRDWMYPLLSIQRAKRARSAPQKDNKQPPPVDIKLEEFFQRWVMGELEQQGQLTIGKRKADDDILESRATKRPCNNTDNAASSSFSIATPQVASPNAQGSVTGEPNTAQYDNSHESRDTQGPANSADSATPASNSVPTPEAVLPNAQRSENVAGSGDLFEFPYGLNREALMSFINAAETENEKERNQ